jgi:dihydrofolate reductase
MDRQTRATSLTALIIFTEEPENGRDCDVPWKKLPQALAWIKEQGQSKAIIMTSDTDRILPLDLTGCKKIILTKDRTYENSKSTLARTVKSTLNLAAVPGLEPVVIGGGETYNHFRSEINTLHLVLSPADMALPSELHHDFPYVISQRTSGQSKEHSALVLGR